MAVGIAIIFIIFNSSDYYEYKSLINVCLKSFARPTGLVQKGFSHLQPTQASAETNTTACVARIQSLKRKLCMLHHVLTQQGSQGHL